MKRFLFIIALLCHLFTAGAQTDNSRLSKPAQSTAPALSQPSGNYGAHDYVDLGLPSGTLWATCNIGASTPEGYGDYFAWGETKPKSIYNWSTYFDTSGGGMIFKKYNIVGGKTELDSEDDAAFMTWGNGWCTPSDLQFTELRKNCRWTWTSLNGVNGYVVASKVNGNSLFLPAGGYLEDKSPYGANLGGNYWSRTLDPYYSGNAYFLAFDDENFVWGGYHRNIGRNIRPVRISAL